MPKSIYKSADIHLETKWKNQNREGPHKSGTPETPGGHDTRNRIQYVFSVSLGASLKMEPSGPTWSQKHPQWSQADPKGTKHIQD